jgi:hypothetical protein
MSESDIDSDSDVRGRFIPRYREPMFDEEMQIDDRPPAYDEVPVRDEKDDGYRSKSLRDAVARLDGGLESDDEEGCGDTKKYWCFLCHIRQHPKKTKYTAFSQLRTWMRCHFENEIGPRVFCEKVQMLYNSKLRRYVDGQPHWHKRSIWDHVTVHSMDPFYMEKSRVRARKTMLDQILETQVYEVNKDTGKGRINEKGAKFALAVMKTFKTGR